jgi:hypothetical protein
MHLSQNSGLGRMQRVEDFNKPIAGIVREKINQLKPIDLRVMLHADHRLPGIVNEVNSHLEIRNTHEFGRALYKEFEMSDLKLIRMIFISDGDDGNVPVGAPCRISDGRGRDPCIELAAISPDANRLDVDDRAAGSQVFQNIEVVLVLVFGNRQLDSDNVAAVPSINLEEL